jgi:hypothetical protein
VVQNPATGSANTNDFLCRPPSIDEHGDRFDKDSVEGCIGELKGLNVGLRDRDIRHTGSPDVGSRAPEHEWVNVDGRDVAPKSASHLNRGGRHTAPHVEHLLTRLEAGELAHFGSRAAAVWVDDPLADDGHESVGVEAIDLNVARLVGAHRRTPGLL